MEEAQGPGDAVLEEPQRLERPEVPLCVGEVAVIEQQVLAALLFKDGRALDSCQRQAAKTKPVLFAYGQVRLLFKVIQNLAPLPPDVPEVVGEP